MPRKMNNSHYYCSQNTLGPVEGGMEEDAFRFRADPGCRPGGVVAYPFQGTLVFQLDAIGEVVD